MTPTTALRSIQRPERLHGAILQQLQSGMQVNAMTIPLEKWMLILFASIAAGGTAPAFAGGDLRPPETDPTPGVAETSFGASVSASFGSSVGTSFGSLPLVFEQNAGQSHSSVRFVGRGAAFDAFLTDEGTTVVVGQSLRNRGSVIQIRPIHGRKSAVPTALEPLAGTTNYFLGNDPSQYVVDAKTFARVKYESVYPGIDMLFYGTQHELEYDLVVAPKADPRAIALELQGVDQLTVLPEGSLALHTPSGDIELRKPVAYQDIRGTR